MSSHLALSLLHEEASCRSSELKNRTKDEFISKALDRGNPQPYSEVVNYLLETLTTDDVSAQKMRRSWAQSTDVQETDGKR